MGHFYPFKNDQRRRRDPRRLILRCYYWTQGTFAPARAQKIKKKNAGSVSIHVYHVRQAKRNFANFTNAMEAEFYKNRQIFMKFKS